MHQRFFQWSNTQIEQLVDVLLPTTQERRTWRLTLSPRFGDLKNRDHFRLPTGIVYGFNARTEGELVLDTFVPNPFKDGNRTGIANIRPKIQYQWNPIFDQTTSAASGIRVVRPISGAPAEINHGINRYSVYTTFSRPSRSIAPLEKFLTLSYDLITPSSVVGELPEYLPQNDFVQVTVGGLYRMDRFTYGLSFSWAHTVDGYSSNYFYLTPSILMDVPSRWVFNSPGQWQVGTSLETRRYGSETDFSVRVRVRWLIDFGRAVRHLTGFGDHDEPGR